MSEEQDTDNINTNEHELPNYDKEILVTSEEQDTNNINKTEHEIPIYTTCKPNYGKEILVMSGGGIRGLIHIGALQKLYEERIIDNIKIYAGTSAGGIILGLFLIGYSPKELFEFTKVFNFENAINFNITNFSSSFGVDNGTRFEFMLKKFIKKKTNDENFTLQQLYNKTNKTFVVTTTCVNTQQLEYLDYINYPDLPLWKALRMTSSVPYFFVPFKFNDKWYVDGACMDNYPASRYKEHIDKIIGVYIVETRQTLDIITNLEDFSFQLLQCLRHSLNKKSINGFENCTVVICNDIGFLDMNLSIETKNNMYNDGYHNVDIFLQKIKP